MAKPSVEDLPVNYAITNFQDIVRDNKRQVLVCSRHKLEELKFHCLDCDQLLCSECLLINSSGKQYNSHVHNLR